jgi:hypothetical protein
MYRALPVQLPGTDLWKIEISQRLGNGPWKVESYSYEEGLPKHEAFKKAEKRNRSFQDQAN